MIWIKIKVNQNFFAGLKFEATYPMRSLDIQLDIPVNFRASIVKAVNSRRLLLMMMISDCNGPFLAVDLELEKQN